MKKFTPLIITAIIALCLFSCKKNADTDGKHNFTIVTSFYPVYMIAKNVTADVKDIDLINMTQPMTGCLHDYSITAEAMMRLEKADIFLINGAGMESFLEKTASKFPNLKTAALSQNIALLNGEEGANPHVWVSVTNAITMTQNCADALSNANPENKSAYQKNAGVYIEKLNALKDKMHEGLRKYKGGKVITFHEAFPYLAKEFGFTITAVIEREPGSEPSAKELAETVETVKREKVSALFAEPQYPAAAAKTVSEETGATLYYLDPAVTGSDDKDAYIKTMEMNLEVLKKAFEGESTASSPRKNTRP